MTQAATGVTLVNMPSTTLAAVQRVLSSDIDPMEAAGRVRRIGMEVGGELYEAFREHVAHSGSLENLESDAFWSSLDELFQQLGWGRVDHERLHPGVIAIASPDWFESRSREADQPCCHFTVGALADLFRRVAGMEVAVLEVRCQAAGASECRFLIGSPDALESVFDRIADGGHYREAVASLG